MISFQVFLVLCQWQWHQLNSRAQMLEAWLVLTMYQPSNMRFRTLSWYLKPVETNLTSSSPGQDITSTNVSSQTTWNNWEMTFRWHSCCRRSRPGLSSLLAQSDPIAMKQEKIRIPCGKLTSFPVFCNSFVCVEGNCCNWSINVLVEILKEIYVFHFSK